MKQIFTLLAYLLLSVATYGQQTVTGTVTSAVDNEPLPGVSIQIVGATKGTVTDLDGNYKLEVQSDMELQFSFIGYSTQTIPVNGRSIINIGMMEDIATLSEVVVVGYGTLKKSDLTGSVSSIKGEELSTVPTVNPVDALQGKVAGVQITNSSGAPGSSPTVKIRGIGTPGNTSPIYVVDGVILNDISFLNARDIESVEVLKDASALAIYGNRGANGVIIVTTKLGTAGQPTKIAINSEYGVQLQQRRIDLLTGRQFAEVVNAIDPGTYNNLDVLPDTDWQDLIFEQAPIQNHQLSISGASEKNQYYFSLGYFDQFGTIPESRYQRITMKINEKYTPKSYLAIGTNLTIAPFQRNNTIGNAPFNAYRAWPIIEPYNENGDFNLVPNVGNILADFRYNTDNQSRGITTVGQVYAEAKFLDGFTLKTSLGVELLLEGNESFTPVFEVPGSAQANPVSNYTKSTFRRSSIIWENTLSYDRKIDVHQINGVVGYTTQAVTNEGLSITARDLIRENADFRYLDPSNVDVTTISNGIRDLGDYYNQISYLARFNYSYDSRYIATFTFRRDGSSKFLQDNKYGNFPAVGLGWNVINEDFISLPEVLTNLKVRGSWGRIGNDKISYVDSYSRVGNNLNAVFGLPEAVYFGQSYTGFGNANLIWELVEQYDIGLELGLFEGRMSAEFDYYNRDTKNILIGLPVPLYLGNGTGSVTFNAGEARNRGFEFNINWDDNIGDFEYNIGINGATLDNEMLKVSGVEGSDELLGDIGGTVTRTIAGSDIGSFYGYKVAGVFQNTDQIANTPSFSGTQPGDLIFADTNLDGQLNGEDRTNIGSPIPYLTYGINLGASYKGFGISALVQGQEGNEILNFKETVRPDRYNFEAHVYNYWRGEGSTNSEPRPTDGGNNYRISDFYIQDGSFIRLRTITVSYDLPADLIEKAGLSTARIYVRGNNIFTITDYTGYSPEIGGGPLLSGIDRGEFPVNSSYSLGINLTF